MLLNKSPYLCPIYGKQKRSFHDKSFIHNFKNKSQIIKRTFSQVRTEKAPLTKNLGIIDFFKGKNIFVTGATGLRGKVLVEKILRSTPVGKIYVMVRAEDLEAATHRLAKELTNSELFGSLRGEHGKYYEDLIMAKPIPVVGNICEPNLGMDVSSARTIKEDVNVITESAAITTLSERYDLLLHTTVNGPQSLMNFAKSCKKLQILVHFSTAYVNGEREGMVLETPVIMGESKRTSDKSSDASSSLFPRLDSVDEIKLALKSCDATTNYEMTKNMNKLGMERARFHGWHNAYHMSKAMAEMEIQESRQHVPLLIIRPSVIESCSKEPLKGWIQGNRMYDPVIISYGKGQIPAYLGDPHTPMDIIPPDIVVNATIAAIAKHGQMQKSESNVYQIAWSVVNPLPHKDFFDFLHEYFSSEPLIEYRILPRSVYFDNVARIKFFDNIDDFSRYTRQEVSRRLGIEDGVAVDPKRGRKLQRQLKAAVSYAEQLCKLCEFAGFYKGRFHSGNVQKLLAEMSVEEQVEFGVDIAKIDWKKYVQQVHIPGLRNHVLHGNKLSVYRWFNAIYYSFPL